MDQLPAGPRAVHRAADSLQRRGSVAWLKDTHTHTRTQAHTQAQIHPPPLPGMVQRKYLLLTKSIATKGRFSSSDIEQQSPTYLLDRNPAIVH